MTTKNFTADRVRHVLTESDLKAFLQRVNSLSGETLVFDVETTTLNEWLPYSRLSCATFTFGEDENYFIPLSHPDSPFRGQWRKVLTRIATCMRLCRWVGQNVPFDVRWVFAMTGIDLSDRIATDTMLGSHLLNDLSSTSLKPRAVEVFGCENWADFDWKWIEAQQQKDPKIHLNRCPRLSERVEYFQLALYATADTYWTWRLLQYQNHELRVDPGLRASLERDYFDLPADDREQLRLGRYRQAIGDRAVGSLARMSINGMMVNRDWCASRLTENEGVIAQREQELYELVEDPFAGIERDNLSYNPNSHWFKNWARQMVVEGKLREVGVTEKGDLSWDASCLKRNARLGMTAAEPLMDLRTRTTENQFLRVWLYESEIDGRIHANFNFARTRTGRLSSSDPNLQQVSRVMKDAFQSAPGKILVTADYSQIELRVAAWLANIEPILQAYRDGRDLHIMAGGMGAPDAALQTAELLCLWAGVPADRAGCEILRRVLREEGPRIEQAEVVRLCREAGADQASWDWIRWGPAWDAEPELQGRQREILSSLPWEPVRGVWTRWLGIEAVGTPHQRESFGQPALELEDALLVLSQADARLLTAISGLDWKELRQRGKAISFGFLFGMGAPKFVTYAEDSYDVFFTHEEAVQVRQDFFDMWVGLSDWHEDRRAEVRQTGQVVSPLGRIRRLPDGRSKNKYWRGQAERQGINTPVQNTASDMMLVATNQINTYDWIKIVAIVHDAIIVEVDEDRAEEAAAIVKHTMESYVPEYLRHYLGVRLTVPLVADTSYGHLWGQQTELVV